MGDHKECPETLVELYRCSHLCPSPISTVIGKNCRKYEGKKEK